MLSGRCAIRLDDIDTDVRRSSWHDAARVMRARLADLEALPAGCTVEVHVGECWPIPDACRLIAEHSARLNVTIVGAAVRVPRWLDTIADPDVELSLWPTGLT